MPTGDRANRIQVSLDEARCVHAHSVWAICARCVNACPGGALSLERGAKAPSIDRGRCVSCGTCLASCPHTAFSSRGFSERRLLDRTGSGQPLTLHCFLPYGELEGIGAAGQGGTYHLATCLAALTPGALFELALSRPVTLDTRQCQGCVVFARTKRTMAANLQTCRALLADCGRASNLVDSEGLMLQPPTQRAPLDGRAAEAHALHAVVANLFHRVRDPQPAPRPVLAVRASNKRVPPWRRRLRELWDALPHASGADAYRWPALHVDEKRCRACGICMQLCPTGSIRQAFGNGEFVYSFTPGTCADCGLCLISCPVAALSRAHEPAALPFEDAPCFEGAAHPCPACGMPVLDARGEETCRLCQAAEKQ